MLCVSVTQPFLRLLFPTKKSPKPWQHLRDPTPDIWVHSPRRWIFGWIFGCSQDYPIYLVFDLDMVHLTTLDRKIMGQMVRRRLRHATGHQGNCSRSTLRANMFSFAGSSCRTPPAFINLPSEQLNQITRRAEKSCLHMRKHIMMPSRKWECQMNSLMTRTSSITFRTCLARWERNVKCIDRDGSQIRHSI